MGKFQGEQSGLSHIPHGPLCDCPKCKHLRNNISGRNGDSDFRFLLSSPSKLYPNNQHVYSKINSPKFHSRFDLEYKRKRKFSDLCQHSAEPTVYAALGNSSKEILGKSRFQVENEILPKRKSFVVHFYTPNIVKVEEKVKEDKKLTAIFRTASMQSNKITHKLNEIQQLCKEGMATLRVCKEFDLLKEKFDSLISCQRQIQNIWLDDINECSSHPSIPIETIQEPCSSANYTNNDNQRLKTLQEAIEELTRVKTMLEETQQLITYPRDIKCQKLHL